MKNLLVILTLFLVGCTSTQQILNSQIKDYNSSIIEVSIVDGENILFTIKNITMESVIIYHPTKLYIEKLSNGSWEVLRISPCPCDAPCNAPSEKEVLATGESYNLNWNKEESWCGTERINKVRNTLKQSVGKGNYRIKINILNDNRKINPIYQEFTIN